MKPRGFRGHCPGITAGVKRFASYTEMLILAVNEHTLTICVFYIAQVALQRELERPRKAVLLIIFSEVNLFLQVKIEAQAKREAKGLALLMKPLVKWSSVL